MRRNNARGRVQASRFRQTNIYLSKNFRIFMNQRDWKFIIIATVISLLVCWIIGGNMYENYDSTRSGYFAIVSAAIWIGIFNSIQGICKEHNTITSEYRAGLHLSSYIMSHVIFQFFLCLVQTIILTAIFYCFIVQREVSESGMPFPTEGLIIPFSTLEIGVTLFLIVWGSAVMGIMISSFSPTPNFAMTAMPFVLIIQLVMSGVLFVLEGASEVIANITFSKWGMQALGSTGELNNPELEYKMAQLLNMPIERSGDLLDAAYNHEIGNVLGAWGFILLIIFVCIVISILSLKIKNRNS